MEYITILFQDTKKRTTHKPLLVETNLGHIWTSGLYEQPVANV